MFKTSEVLQWRSELEFLLLPCLQAGLGSFCGEPESAGYQYVGALCCS